jgi:hypothetical protein
VVKIRKIEVKELPSGVKWIWPLENTIVAIATKFNRRD